MPQSSPDLEGLAEAVGRYIARHGLCAPGQRVLVAVSGGADSMALLHLLHRLGYDVVAAHGNHGSRGQASDEDEAFVQAQACAMAIPCETRRLDLAGPGSFEMRARAARYTMLREIALARQITHIALGHSLDDQAETMLLRLIRGVGPEGLGAMAPKRSEGPFSLIRPLLDTRRDMLRDWLRAEGLPWREDASNEDPAFQRNRIRHQWLPLIRSLNPRAEENLSRLAQIMRVENEWLDTLIQEAEQRVCKGDRILRGPFLELAQALQWRVLRRYAWRLGAAPDMARVEAACAFVAEARSGAHFDLGNGVELTQTRAETLPKSWGTPPGAVALSLPGVAPFGPWQLQLQEAPASDINLKARCGPWYQLLDRQAFQGPLVLRGPKSGDRFAPLGMEGTKSLKDYLQDRGIAAQARAHVPVLCAGETVLWVAGHGPSRLAAITPKTRTWVVCEILERQDHDLEQEPAD